MQMYAHFNPILRIYGVGALSLTVDGCRPNSPVGAIKTIAKEERHNEMMALKERMKICNFCLLHLLM